MKKLVKQLICKHEYHNRGEFRMYDGIRKKKNIYKCFKCGKVKKTTVKRNKYNLSKVRI